MSWVKRTANKMDTARANFDKEKDLECLQKQCLDSEEITGEQLIFVMGHEMLPTERRLAFRKGRPAMPFVDVADGCRVDVASAGCAARVIATDVYTVSNETSSAGVAAASAPQALKTSASNRNKENVIFVFIII